MAGTEHAHQRVTNGCPEESCKLKNGNGILSTNGNHHKGLNGGDPLLCKSVQLDTSTKRNTVKATEFGVW